MIVRSWNLRPRPGRYDDAIGLITEGVKLAERHGAEHVRLTQAATAGTTTGLLVLTCEFENATAYGGYLDETMMDAEAIAYSHRIREAEAPFVYESTAVMREIDLDRADAKRGRGRVIDARFGRHIMGRWEETLGIARQVFDVCDENGAVGCRLFELDHAGDRTGWLCATMEYESLKDFGKAEDSFMMSLEGRNVVSRLRDDPPFESLTAGLFTEVALF